MENTGKPTLTKTENVARDVIGKCTRGELACNVSYAGKTYLLNADWMERFRLWILPVNLLYKKKVIGSSSKTSTVTESFLKEFKRIFPQCSPKVLKNVLRRRQFFTRRKM